MINNDSLQEKNEKQILSIYGEELAKEKMGIDELKSIDKVYSSNYIRSISTAKYIADYNNLEINIHEGFGERKFGINSYDEITTDFYDKQAIDENYKLGNGESQKEVRERMYNSLISILENDKKIAIVSHSTAILFLLMKWCDIDYKTIKFQDRIIAPTKIDNCAIFKLIFDDNNDLISIENIK
ncbi:MAG: histidine phosphatase family protein [Erysipelotrichaceae bacterium]|nr:histidine phosphatase family protein [Erysipelotrichaceae bacterium]